MSAHLPDDAIVELAFGRGDDRERAHLAGCGRCSSRWSELDEMLAAVRAADVPEPPAGYWPALARAVSRRIDEAPRHGLAWNLLAPLAAVAAAVVVALAPAHGPLATQAPRVDAPAASLGPWSALPPFEEDAAVPVLAVAAEPAAAALEGGEGLGSFVAGLTDDEAQALAERLRAPRREGDL
jgi:hypothetical protein